MPSDCGIDLGLGNLNLTFDTPSEKQLSWSRMPSPKTNLAALEEYDEKFSTSGKISTSLSFSLNIIISIN